MSAQAHFDDFVSSLVERKPGSLVPIEGEVWCLTHGTVHEVTLDPYGEGYATCEEYGERDVHRRIYWRARKGDLA